MNKINRKLEYALMALKYMSQKIPGELTTAKEVSDQLGSPFDATARVMQLMAQKGLLRSEQGAFGGYQITKDLAKVSMQDLVDMIEGPTAIAKCFHKENACEMQVSCNIFSPIMVLNQKLTDFYSGVNLKDLLVEPLLAKATKRKISDEVANV